MFVPTFRITMAITKALMSVAADRQAIIGLPIDVEILRSLRQRARIAAKEGRNYDRAIEEVESMALGSGPVTGRDIRLIHGLVIDGRASPTPYRDGQNVIRDSISGGIVYTPPDAKDVPILMAELVAWTNLELERGEIPAPIIASLAHYQYATIRPYYDGNGRTARLLTALILHRAGYGLKGIYSLGEYYGQNLARYYEALAAGPSHNYYAGRAEADATAFVEYFCAGMAESIAGVRAQVMQAAKRGATDIIPQVRKLDARKRQLLSLFRGQATATSSDIAAHLGISPRTVLVLSRDWMDDGFLILHDPARKSRSYRLADDYERLLIGTDNS